jgi:hypothetical protein
VRHVSVLVYGVAARRDESGQFHVCFDWYELAVLQTAFAKSGYYPGCFAVSQQKCGDKLVEIVVGLRVDSMTDLFFKAGHKFYEYYLRSVIRDLQVRIATNPIVGGLTYFINICEML